MAVRSQGSCGSLILIMYIQCTCACLYILVYTCVHVYACLQEAAQQLKVDVHVPLCAVCLEDRYMYMYMYMCVHVHVHVQLHRDLYTKYTLIIILTKLTHVYTYMINT